MFPMLRIALLFVILIVYGSLYPFDNWSAPRAPLFHFLLHWPAVLTRADLVQNVLAYAPFGLFYALHRLARRPAWGADAVRQALGAAFLLSLTMEALQQFEPARTASLADIAMNVLGALAGAVLALMLKRHPPPDLAAAGRAPYLLNPLLHRLLHRLHLWRRQRFHSGVLPNIGLAAIALWVLAETSPLAPVFDPAYLARKLAILAWQLQHPLRVNPAHILVSAGQLIGIGCLLRSLARPATVPSTDAPNLRADLLFIALLGAVFCAKLLVLGRYLQLAELAGAALALGIRRLGAMRPTSRLLRRLSS